MWISTNFFKNIPNSFFDNKIISLRFCLIDLLQVYIMPEPIKLIERLSLILEKGNAGNFVGINH